MVSLRNTVGVFNPTWIGVIGGAFAASYALGFLVNWWLLHQGVLDRPNERSSHTSPTPRGGGIAIMVVIWGGAAWLKAQPQFSMVLIGLVGSIALAVVSFLDDRRSVSWWMRLGLQFLAAVVSVASLGWSGSGQGWNLAVIISPVLVFWITGYANAFNFMDGINGLAAGQALLTGVGTALVAVAAGVNVGHPAVALSLLLGGAAAGFLPHNFPRARMFMGDVGSVPLGFLLAFLTGWIAHDHGWWLLLPLGCLHANFVLDTAITLVRRWRQREALHKAHRDHFYQRLNRAGCSHSAVTATELGLQLVIVSLATAAAKGGPLAKVGVLVATAAMWLIFFAVCEREFLRSAKAIRS